MHLVAAVEHILIHVYSVKGDRCDMFGTIGGSGGTPMLNFSISLCSHTLPYLRADSKT